MVSVRVSLILKRSYKIFPQETMAASENRFAPGLNEKEVIELLVLKYGVKIFQGKNLKTLF